MDSIGALKPDPHNARRHTPRNVGMVVTALHDVGAARSIVIDEDNMILAGNATIEAAAAAGITRLKIIDADGEEIIAVRRSGLTAEQKTRLALYDNRAAELADWDDTVIAELAIEVDLSSLFADDELAAILSRLEPAPGLTDPDEIPEPPAEPITQPGDLWQLGRHRLLCGDSTVATDVERLMAGEQADMVFTDPPYGIGYQSNARTATQAFDVLRGDDHINADWLPIISHYIADNGAVYICTRWDVYPEWYALVSGHMRVKNLIVWDKVDWSSGDLGGDYSPRHEFILFCTKGRHLLRGHRDSNVWQFGAPNKQNYLHPTQKKVEVPQCAIEHSSDSNNLILDLFGGSGSTLIACEQTGRRCAMMELDPTYCDVIVKRFENFTGQQAERVQA